MVILVGRRPLFLVVRFFIEVRCRGDRRKQRLRGHICWIADLHSRHRWLDGHARFPSDCVYRGLIKEEGRRNEVNIRCIMYGGKFFTQWQ